MREILHQFRQYQKHTCLTQTLRYMSVSPYPKTFATNMTTHIKHSLQMPVSSLFRFIRKYFMLLSVTHRITIRQHKTYTKTNYLLIQLNIIGVYFCFGESVSYTIHSGQVDYIFRVNVYRNIVYNSCLYGYWFGFDQEITDAIFSSSAQMSESYQGVQRGLGSRKEFV